MPDLPRLEIEELLARYELEPEIRDIYVEGVFDKDLLTYWSRDKTGDCVFYEIDVVNVPSGLLTRHGFTEGNRQRVIALARELAVLAGDPAYRCVADCDLDHWFGPLEGTARLRWTKYSAIETYFLKSELVNQFVVVVARSRIGDWEAFFASFVDVLKDFYAFRLADRDLGWNLSWIEFKRSLQMSDGQVEFDRVGYQTKLLHKNSKFPQREAFNQRFERWRARLDECDGKCVRGHDFVGLMAWVIEKCGGVGQFASSAALERLLVFASKDRDELAELVA